MVVSHGHFPSLAPLLGGPLCLVEEEVGTFSHWLGLHGGESPWLAVSKSGAPHSLAARCLLLIIIIVILVIIRIMITTIVI